MHCAIARSAANRNGQGTCSTRPVEMNPFESWQEEQRSAFGYRALARLESDPVKSGLFAKLATEATTQSEFWLHEIERAGQPAPVFAPDRRARLVIALTERLGVRAMRPILAALKV